VETTRARQTGSTEIVLQEFLHLAAALTDQSDDGDVRGHIAGQHRQQYRLTDARAGEDTHALAAANRDEGIERAHTEIERITDAAACMSRRRRIAIRIGCGAGRQRPLSVDRFSSRVNDTAEPTLRGTDGAGGSGYHGAAAAAHAIQRGKWHRQRMTT